MFNEEEIKLAKSTVEKITEKEEMTCPECKGNGKIALTHSGSYNISFSAKLVSCPTCNSAGKVKRSTK